MRRARRLLRPLGRALRGPCAGALDLALRASGRKRAAVLVYHRVGDPPGDPDVELVPALGSVLFAAQLRLLCRRYRIVPAAELLDAALARRRFGRFPVAITFDDDWPGHKTVTAPLLAAAGAPATFFLNGAPAAFWFELLQAAYDCGLLAPPAAIHEHAARIQAMPAEQRAREAQALRDRLGEPPRGAVPADDVRALAREGHEIGFHTRDHETLTTVRGEALDAALRNGREQLEQAAGAKIDAIAYPGGAVDAEVLARVRAAGFARGYTTRAEPLAAGVDPLAVGRVYPAHDTAGRLFMSLARTLARAPQTGVATR